MTENRLVVNLGDTLNGRLRKEAERTGRSLTRIVEEALHARLPEETGGLPPVVAFLLREGEPHPKPDWQNGGRWLLDWFLLREPDWQKHHTVRLARCWPLPYEEPELRCGGNLGDPRPLLQHLHEIREPFHRDDAAFPKDLPNPTLGEWCQTLRIYEGCCGEKIRPPGASHWDCHPSSPAS